MSTTTRGAVMTAIHTDWAVTDLTLQEPRAGEVLVKMAYAGMCHSDEHIKTGTLSPIPVVGGHEGSGVVVAVGQNVSRLAPGDHVVLSFVPTCGHCRWCSSGRSNLCEAAAISNTGELPDGTFRFATTDGKELPAHCTLGTFAEHSVVSADSCVKIDKDIPLSVAALVSCGVMTGWGSAVYAGNTQVGDTVIVVGAGGVGLNAVQGADHAGAANVIVVDPVAAKQKVAATMGATHSAESLPEAAALAAGLNPTAGGADVTIICTGDVDAATVTASYEATGKGGTLVLAGLSHDPQSLNVQLPGNQLIFADKRIQGSIFGSCNPFRDVPLLLNLYRQGKLKLDELVSRTYTLDEINDGFADLRAGRNLRGLVEHRN